MTSPERALRAAQQRLHELEAEREVVAKDLGTAGAGLGARSADTAELQGRVASFRARLTELDAGIPVARKPGGDAEQEVVAAERRAATKRARALAKKRDNAAARFDAAVRDMDSAWTEFADLASGAPARGDQRGRLGRGAVGPAGADVPRRAADRRAHRRGGRPRGAAVRHPSQLASGRPGGVRGRREVNEAVVADAARLAKGATDPGYTKAEYEDALLELADSESRPGESVGAALSRLMVDHDERVAALGKAAYVAEHVEEQRRGRAAAKGARVAAETGAGVHAVMEKYAAQHRRPDEAPEATFDRLCAEGDPVMKALYAVYTEE